MSSGCLAISTRRMRPPQPWTGQVVASTAKTRRKSQALDAERRRGGRGERGEVGGGEERELRRRLELAAEDDLGARGRVRGEDAVVAEHVKPRRRDEGAEPRDEVEGVEQDGVGAVFPRGLEGEADAPIGVELEALLVERGSGDVAAEPLEALSVAAVDDDLGVDIYPTHLGERFAGRGDEAHGVDELGGLVSWRRAEELHVPADAA